MAKKPAPSTHQPSLSSSYEEEEEEEESSSSSEEEETINTKPDPQKVPAKNQESESESEEESSDEEDNEQPQPVSSTPSKPKPEPEKIVTLSKPISKKSSSKPPFVRLWSLDDEVAILEALVDYQSKNGPIKLNTAVLKEFHNSVRKSLSVDVGTDKLAAKMRSLKNKYTSANKKGDKLKFAKDHDKIIYELSKKAWGKEEEEEVGYKAKALNGDSSGATVDKGKSLKRDFPYVRAALGGNRATLEMLETVDVEKAIVLEKKLKKVKFMEMNLMRKVYDMLAGDSKQSMD